MYKLRVLSTQSSDQPTGPLRSRQGEIALQKLSGFLRTVCMQNRLVNHIGEPFCTAIFCAGGAVMLTFYPLNNVIQL